jgi:general stress protein 26
MGGKMSALEEKIFRAIKSPQVMPLATVTEEGKPWVRYITGWGSEDLTVRFVTSLQSRKVGQIKSNPEVHLTCGAQAAGPTEHYLQIAGRARFTRDKKERQRFWNDELKAYFSGPDDPAYCICIIKPNRIESYGMTESEPQVWEARKGTPRR